MDIDDRVLPAAPHLTGPGASAVLAPVVAHHGGELVEVRPTQVLYRPGRDLVVGYAATVRWPGGLSEETLLAGTTTAGAPEGTITVEADDMEVGVWRYPFDPSLPGLADAVLVDPVARLLDADPGAIRLDVVSFRPSKRAVVRVTGAGDPVFLKVLPPSRAAPVVARHASLLAAGVPVPEVLAADPARGLVALRALPGVDLRDRLVLGDGPVPPGDAILEVVDAIARADVPAPDRPRTGLLDGAAHHAALVRRVAPGEGARLELVLSRIAAARRAWSPAPVHGDLHEAQIRVDADGEVVGVLDVDDVGPGDPADDPSRAIAHLVALSLAHAPSAPRSLALAADLHGAASARHGAEAVRIRVAAALVGLATGPFRAQDADWPDGTARVVDAAVAWSDERGGHERTLRSTS